jgi:crotonobetainyl-CoA:carnitine CoA-transferase CaiB-like acyl-CoA transferase
MVGKVAHPTAGEVSLIASPLKLSGTPPVTMVAPPLLGEHTQEVLRRFGLAEMALGGNNGSATS